MITYSIADVNCSGCSLCIKACPSGAITFKGKKQPVVLDKKKCSKCGACYDVCKLGAVTVN
ncbi:4Fe-4S binding protein [Chloroflexota bacterium]